MSKTLGTLKVIQTASFVDKDDSSTEITSYAFIYAGQKYWVNPNDFSDGKIKVASGKITINVKENKLAVKKVKKNGGKLKKLLPVVKFGEF